MSEANKGTAEEVLGVAFGVMTSLVVGLADLLIAKDIISRSEFSSLVTRLIAAAPKSGEHEEMVRMLLQAALLPIAKDEAPDRRANRP